MMRFLPLKVRWFALGLFLVLLAGAGVVFVERDALRAWYVLRGLRQATDADAPAWIEKTAAVGEPAVPGVLALFDSDNPADRARAEAALMALPDHWGADDSRTEDMTERLTLEFASRPPHAQCATLRIARTWFHPTPTERLAERAGRLLVLAAASPDDTVFLAALQLAEVASHAPMHPETRHAARALAQRGLKTNHNVARLQALDLARTLGSDFLRETADLLNDPAPDIRRAALRALLPRAKDLNTDALLPWLHDLDEEVRSLCERALRQRGLNSDYLRLAKLVAHPQWDQRLLVLDQLDESPELDATVWLRRLTHDPAPAVRLAAIRAASEAQLDALSDRLDQMSRQDPSPTVTELARHYQRKQVERSRMQR